MFVYEDSLSLMDSVTGQQQWETPTEGGENHCDMPIHFSRRLCGYVYNLATGNDSGEYSLILLDRRSGKETHRLTCWKYKGKPELAKKCFRPELRKIDNFLILFPTQRKSNACVIAGGPSIFCLRLSKSKSGGIELQSHFYVHIETYLSHVFASEQSLFVGSDVVSQNMVCGLRREMEEDSSHILVKDCSFDDTCIPGIVLCTVSYHLFAGRYYPGLSRNHSLTLTMDLEKAHRLEEPCRTFAVINIPRCYQNLLLNRRDRVICPTNLQGKENQEEEERVVLDVCRYFPYTVRKHSFLTSFQVLDFEEEKRGDLLTANLSELAIHE